MVIDMREYAGRIRSQNISILYTGPMWNDGVKSIAELVRTNLSHEELPGSAAKSIFSVFVEQVTNMCMYSSEKEEYICPEKGPVDISMGMLVLGRKDNIYFIQTGNAVNDANAKIIKERIDYLNTLDKKSIRQYYKEQMRSENENPESKGAGLGLTEIAKRATAPIAYTFEPLENGNAYFTMYVEIGQERQGD